MSVLNSRRGLRWTALAAIMAITLGVLGSTVGEVEAATTTDLTATLSEWKITLNSAEVQAGDVTVVAKNAGAVSHELVVLKTNVAPDQLEMVANRVDESKYESIGEIADFDPPTTQSATFKFAAGKYVLICNIAGHYQQGMRVALTVVQTGTATATATATATTTATATATATPTAAPTTAPTTAPSGPQAPLQPETAPINITLRGSNEVPPVTTGVANGTFRATPGSSSLGFTLTASGAGMTAAHIHLGAAGTNGPVIAFLYGPNAAGTNAITQSGSITAANFVGPMAGKTWADFTAALNSGQLYVNIHSVANPGGEIRAQIPGSGAAPGAPKTGNTLAENGSGAMLLFAALGIAGLFMVSAGSAVALRRRD